MIADRWEEPTRDAQDMTGLPLPPPPNVFHIECSHGDPKFPWSHVVLIAITATLAMHLALHALGR